MQLPDAIGRYHVQSVVGVGGFGTVVRAFDDELDSSVAVKLLADNWAVDANVRERFVAEARHLRRVRNPHVVNVYDIGELPDGRPWFVMEYAERGNLAQRLDAMPAGVPVDPPSLRRIVMALADGVAAIHAAGLIHRDLNPRNLLICGDGHGEGSAGHRSGGTVIRTGLLGPDERLVVGDMGLAKDIALSGAAASVVGGSPYYQSPEQSDPDAVILPATDVYALSALLWKALTGETPPDPHSVADRIGRIDARWRDVLRRGLALDPDERFDSAIDWRDAVLDCLGDDDLSWARRPVTRLPSTTVSDDCPYRGLAAFQPDDAADFFGREVLLGELVERLRRDRTLVVAGPSGSGKSSLVRAGLVPALASGALSGSAEWPIVLMTPGADPLGELHYQLVRVATSRTGRAPDISREDVRSDAAKARLLADTITDHSGGLFVCIDQFEELFTLCPTPEERSAFIEVLGALVDPIASHVRIVLAMRADFYSQAALHPWLARRITENQVLVGPMNRAELRRAVEGPAKRAGLVVEDGLVDDILDEAGAEPGSLPLVAHALVETWRRRSAGRLTRVGFRDAGGVSGAIAQTAEELYQGFDGGERAAVRTLFLRLVNPGEGTPDTRRRVPLSELEPAGGGDDVAGVVERLVDARLLTAGPEAVEIAHEALIVNWPRLRGWIEDSRDDLRLRQHIGRAAAEWRDRAEDPDLLYRGVPLATAVAWRAEHDAQLGLTERRFLDSSVAAAEAANEVVVRQERRARRVRRLAVAGLAGVVVAAAIGWGAVQRVRSNERETAAEQREVDNFRLLARITSEQDPYSALALGAERLLRAGDTTVEAWVPIVASRQELSSAPLVPFGDPINVGRALTVTASPDGTITAVGLDDGTIRLFDTTSREELVEPLVGHANGIEELVFSPSGEHLASASLDGTAVIWDMADVLGGEPAVQTLPIGSLVWSVAWSPDGSRLATASEDGVVQLWNAATAARIGPPLVDSSFDMLTVAFSPAGDEVIAADGRGEVSGWAVPSGEPLFERVPAHGSDVWELVFAPDGSTFATASSDGTATVRDSHTGELVGETFLDAAGNRAAEDVRGVQFTRDGSALVAGTERGQLVMWDIGEGRVVSAGGVPGTPILDASLVEAAGVAVTVSNDQTMRVWQVDGNLPLGIDAAGLTGGAYGAAFAPDGSFLAVGDGEGGLVMVDPLSGAVDSRLQPGLSGRVWAVAVAPDGEAVAAGDESGDVVVVSPNGASPRALGSHTGAVAAVAYSPDGALLASGGREDGVIRIWGVEDGGLRAETPAGSAGVGGLAWTPDGNRVVAADVAGSVRVWDAAGQPVGEPAEVDRDSIWGVEVSPDGGTVAVATADDIVSLWPAGLDAEPLATISDLDDDATDVGFLVDGLLLVSATRGGAVRLSDAHTGAPVGVRMTGHDGETWSLAVHPDGLHFATTGTDGSVRIWDVLALDRACELTADLVLEEQLRLIGEDVRLQGCESPS